MEKTQDNVVVFGFVVLISVDDDDLKIFYFLHIKKHVIQIQFP